MPFRIAKTSRSALWHQVPQRLITHNYSAQLRAYSTYYDKPDSEKLVDRSRGFRLKALMADAISKPSSSRRQAILAEPVTDFAPPMWTSKKRGLELEKAARQLGALGEERENKRKLALAKRAERAERRRARERQVALDIEEPWRQGGVRYVRDLPSVSHEGSANGMKSLSDELLQEKLMSKKKMKTALWLMKQQETIARELGFVTPRVEETPIEPPSFEGKEFAPVRTLGADELKLGNTVSWAPDNAPPITSSESSEQAALSKSQSSQNIQYIALQRAMRLTSFT